MIVTEELLTLVVLCVSTCTCIIAVCHCTIKELAKPHDLLLLGVSFTIFITSKNNTLRHLQIHSKSRPK